MTWAAEVARGTGSGSWPGASSRRPAPSRNHNTSVLVGPDGEVAARYRKLHLFDVDVPGAVHP